MPVAGLDSQAQQGLSGLILPRCCWPLPPLPCVIHPPPSHCVVRRPPAFLFDCCVLDWWRRGGQHGGRVAAVAAAAQRWRRQQQGNGSSTAAAQRRRSGSAVAVRHWWRQRRQLGSSQAAAQRQRQLSFSLAAVAEAWRRQWQWQQRGSSGSRVAAAQWWQAARCCFYANVCALRLLPLALSLKPQWHKDFLCQRKGQTMHYGLCKILRRAASKTILMVFHWEKNYQK